MALGVSTVNSSFSIPMKVTAAAIRGVWSRLDRNESGADWELTISDPAKWSHLGLPEIPVDDPREAARALIQLLPDRIQRALLSERATQELAADPISNAFVTLGNVSFSLRIHAHGEAIYVYFKHYDRPTPVDNKSWNELEDAYHFFRGLFDQSPNVIFLEDWSRLKDYIDELAASGVTDFHDWANALTDEETFELFELIDILDVSKSSATMFQAKDSKEVMANLPTLLSLLDPVKLRREIASIAVGDKDYKDDYLFRDMAGGEIHGSVAVAVVDGYEDSWKYVIASISEMTMRFQEGEKLKRIAHTLEQSTELFRGTLRHVQMPISLSDESGIIVEANQAYCDFYGRERSGVVGSHFLDHVASLLSDVDREKKMAQYAQFVRLGSSEEFEERLLTHAGWRTINVVRGLYTRPDGQRWVVTSFFDITQLKEAEEQSRKLLQDERKLSDLRSRFISMVSHEFRTPLTAAKMSSGILIKYIDRLPPEMLVKHSEIIGRATRRLEDMIDGVLVISQAGSGKLTAKHKALHLGKYFEELSSEWRAAHSDIHFEGEFSDLPEELIQTDERLLYLAVNNLVSNAVKYSRSADPRVCLRVRAELGGHVRIEIEDNGIGIPEEDQADVFNSYYRAGNVGKVSGTGLGLVVVENSIGALGGTISLKSELGKGSTFLIDFPCIPAPPN